MGDVTRILAAIQDGNSQATDELLPLVYDELRKLAAHRMARESPNQTLQPTALVHEVYVRLVDVENAQRWDGRGHFFAAAAEAMRRILVENARRKGRVKRGGGRARRPIDGLDLADTDRGDEVLDVHEALDRLEETHADAAAIVKLRYFAGFTNKEAAELTGISPRKADQLWAYARAWLVDAIGRE